MNCNPCDAYEMIGGVRTKLVFDIFRGDTGGSFKLGAYNGWFSMVPAYNRTMTPVVSKEMKIETDSNGNATNTMSVILTSKDTYELCGKYIYQITVFTNTGQADVPEQGEIIIHRNIDMAPLNQWEWEDEE